MTEESKWDRVGTGFLFVFAASDFFSISIAQIAVAVSAICWGYAHYSRRKWPQTGSLFWPLLAFIICSLLAALLSYDPAESMADSKDLLHIFIFFIAFYFMKERPERVRKLFITMVVAGALVSLVGFYQTAEKGVDILNRISGFQDIYMTYAGLLMLGVTVGSAIAAFTIKDWKDGWLVFLLLMMVAATLLSLTRNAWIGIGSGLAVILIMRKPASIIAIPIVCVSLFFVAPQTVQKRIISITNPADSTNHERLLLWQAGIKIIADHPFWGVGQNSFPLVYPKYRSPDVEEPNISHLHNNFLQIFAERGLFGFVPWLSIWVVALYVLIKSFLRNRADPVRSAVVSGGVASVVAFLCAGMFEYSFGDSEINMLLFMILGACMANSDGETENVAAPE